MLALHSCAADTGVAAPDLSAAALPAGVVWIDLLDASAAEVAFVERAAGLHVPTLTELSEIESSSRLRSRDGALYLSTPLIYRAQSELPKKLWLLRTAIRMATASISEKLCRKNMQSRQKILFWAAVPLS